MKIATLKSVLLLISGILAVTISGIAFATEQKEEFVFPLESVLPEAQLKIIKKTIKESDFNKTVKVLGTLRLISKNLKESINLFVQNKHLSSYMAKKFFNNEKDKINDQLIHLSEKGTLSPFALTLLVAADADLNKEDKDGDTPLILAAVEGHAKTVKMLIENGADLNKKDKDGGTALIYAASYGYIKIVRELIENGADLNIQENVDGDTALILAASNGDKEIVDLLIKKRADLNKQNINGETALIWAAKEGHTEIADMLLKAGANLDQQDKDGDTALVWAALNKHTKIVEMLMEKGAEFF